MILVFTGSCLLDEGHLHCIQHLTLQQCVYILFACKCQAAAVPHVTVNMSLCVFVLQGPVQSPGSMGQGGVPYLQAAQRLLHCDPAALSYSGWTTGCNLLLHSVEVENGSLQCLLLSLSCCPVTNTVTSWTGWSLRQIT